MKPGLLAFLAIGSVAFWATVFLTLGWERGALIAAFVLATMVALMVWEFPE